MLDTIQHTIRVDYGRFIIIDGEKLNVHLIDTEAKILDYLLRSTAVVTRDMLLNQIYGGMDEPEPRIFDIYIYKLRTKLGPYRGMIETVWGRGWSRKTSYVREQNPMSTMSIDVPLEYVDTISFITGKDAQTAILDIVKTAYKQLQEM